MIEKVGPLERSKEFAKIGNKIVEFFVQGNKLKEPIRKGELIEVEDLARWAGVSEQELRVAISRGMPVSYEEKGWQTNHIVFCDKNLCGLDTEEYARSCLREYLRSLGFDVIGEKDRELSYRKKEALRNLIKVVGAKPKRPLKEMIATYLISNGLDLVAYDPEKAELLIVELKGVTKEKQDMHEAIIQMFKRYRVFEEETTEEEFERIHFGSGLPYFAPSMSRSHYENKFNDLRRMYKEEKPELLYQFASSPSNVPEEGMSILRPFVEGIPNIIELMRRGKVMFMLIEGANSVLNLTSNSQVSLQLTF